MMVPSPVAGLWHHHTMSELPPLDQPQAYVVVGPNDQRGPYTMDLLIGEVVAGRLSDATPVWWPGLADWTTMGAHPAVSAEIARRRAPDAPPAWAAPQSPAPEQPAQQAQDVPAPAQTAPAQTAPDQTGESQAGGAQVEDSASFAPPAAEPVGAEPVVASEPVIETEIVEASVVELDDGSLEAFADLVRRSSERAAVQALVDAADSQLVEAVTEGITSAGFTPAEQIDLEDHHELRFDGPDQDLVVASLGRPTARTAEALRSDHVGLTLSYRASVSGARIDEGTGEHGEVIITADEWTGQSTSSVRLFLGLDHYLDAEGRVRREALAGDIAAATAVLRARLS